jgi:hypothetical protein
MAKYAAAPAAEPRQEPEQQEPEQEPQPEPQQEPEPQEPEQDQQQELAPARPGTTRLGGFTLVDDAGPYLGLGASLFWAVWGVVHDAGRLRENMTWLRQRGVDYIRTLAIVGPGGGWEDRAVDSNHPNWAEAVAASIDLAHSVGLRTQLTIFGGVDTVPTRTQRRDVIQRVANVLAGRQHMILYVEIGNEAWKNGFPDTDGVAELTDHANLLASLVPGILVAKTAPIAEYRSEGPHITPYHLDRNQTGTGQVWRPMRQPWEASFGGPWVNQEGIGIQSSGGEDRDPLRLTCYALNTWLCGGAAFTLHHGAGIRGGGIGDTSRGRASNVWEQPELEPTLRAIVASRDLLPTDLPNWRRHNSNGNFPAYPFDTDALAAYIPEGGHGMLRAFCATSSDGRLVMLPLQVSRDIPMVARRTMHLAVFHPLTQELVKAEDVAAGGTFILPGSPAKDGRPDGAGAYLVLGQFV